MKKLKSMMMMTIVGTIVVATPISSVQAFAPVGNQTNLHASDEVSIQAASRTVEVRVRYENATPRSTYYYNRGGYSGTIPLVRTERTELGNVVYGVYRGTVRCSASVCPI